MSLLEEFKLSVKRKVLESQVSPNRTFGKKLRWFKKLELFVYLFFGFLQLFNRDEDLYNIYE